MSGPANRSFNLPWHQYDHYWISIFAKSGTFAPAMQQALKATGLQNVSPDRIMIKTGRDWKSAWDGLYAILQDAHALSAVEVSVTPGDAVPTTTGTRHTTAAMQVIAESMWLGDALMEDRLLCYLQPVISGNDKIFGYESFARVQEKDGTVIGGDKIVAASRALSMEYMIDRHLHVQAIKTFASSQFNGFLFVNFFPGFIHRPAVYLEGLSETAKSFGVVAKHLVLDFTRAEAAHDLTHLKSVCEYGRSRGYSIALDDIESVEGARKLVPEIKPDFVKIGMQLVRRIAEPDAHKTIRGIVDLVHASGCTVIGEGVETEEMHTRLKQLGVDLFQGYLFSPPAPVEVALKKSTA